MRKYFKSHNGHRFVTGVCDFVIRYRTAFDAKVTDVTTIYKNIKYLLLLYIIRSMGGRGMCLKSCDFVTFARNPRPVYISSVTRRVTFNVSCDKQFSPQD
jgi:hypothetical protein